MTNYSQDRDDAVYALAGRLLSQTASSQYMCANTSYRRIMFLTFFVHFLKIMARVRVKCILCTSYKVSSIFLNLWLGLGLNAYYALLTSYRPLLKFMARVRVKCILCTSYKVSIFRNLWLGLGLGLNAYYHFLQGAIQLLKFIARVRVKCILCTSYKVPSNF